MAGLSWKVLSLTGYCEEGEANAQERQYLDRRLAMLLLPSLHTEH